MMASLFSGVSGLKNHQTKLNVIGNNIANVNTIGYKAGRINFQEALVQTYKGAGRPSSVSGGTNPQQLGLGMQVATIDNLFLQGGLETTGQITDMAIQGAGFFILGDNNGNSFYTRAGAFGFDADSNMVDPATGLFVQGKMADSSGEIPSLATSGNINIPFGQQDPARATEVVRLGNNIDASITDASVASFDEGGFNVETVSGTAVDGVGGVHSITILGDQATNSTFQRTPIVPERLTLLTTLTDVGVTDFDNFGFGVDGATADILPGLDGDTTIEEVINAINQVDGITAELDSGEILITRDKAGAYTFESLAGTATNIIGLVFGEIGTSIDADNGLASTYVATDSFQPDRGYGAAAGPVSTVLGLVIDDVTGLVKGLSGIGGGGIEMTTRNDDLQFTALGDPLEITTEPTLHAMSINVYDSQGGRHTLTVEFFKSIVDNRWEWSASTTGIENITAGGSGYTQFNSDGSLNTFEFFGGATGITIDPNNGADTMHVDLDAGSVGEFDGLTGFSSGGSHLAQILGQDGYGLGLLEKIDIDQAGNISGIFSNGVTRVLAQIMLADFNNQQGLRKAGRSMFQASPNSGEAVEGVAGSTISGMMTSGALESSNVDIAQEFTSMITAQRGFQANARIITTSDQMLDELVNLKR